MEGMMSDANKYRNAILAANEMLLEAPLTGDTLLVEVMDLKEYQKSSIIISSGATKQTNGMEANMPVFVRVLLVGEGFYNDDNETEAPDCCPGDILLVGQNSVVSISQYGQLCNYGRINLGICNLSQKIQHFRGQMGFDRFFTPILKAVENGQVSN
jgi:co-chaperonin GroES (HSP10)